MPSAPAFLLATPLAAAPRSTTHHASTTPRHPPPRMTSSNGAPPASKPRFSIRKTVLPGDSDYSMSLWHGAYVRWLEEARVCYLQHLSLPYDVLVREHGTELVVRDLQVQYIKPLKLGDVVDVSVQLAKSSSRLRMPLETEFQLVGGKTCATGSVTLVAVDAQTGKPKRVWPQILTDTLLDEVEAARRE